MASLVLLLLPLNYTPANSEGKPLAANCSRDSSDFHEDQECASMHTHTHTHSQKQTVECMTHSTLNKWFGKVERIARRTYNKSSQDF